MSEEKHKETTKQFYTPYGWEGNKYQKTRDLPLKTKAKRIKKEILAKHPDIKVSVRTEHFSMGCAIRIKITKYNGQIGEAHKNQWGSLEYRYTKEAKALLDSIQHIADEYRFNDSDAQIDYFNTNFYCTPDFDHDLTMKEYKDLGFPTSL